MRTFLAILLPPALQTHVQNRQVSLQRILPPHLARVVRWTPPGNTHLTLRFMGKTSTAQRRQIHDTLMVEMAQHGPLTMALNGVGVFPQWRKPTVLWLGISGDLAGLGRLQSVTEQTARAAGFPAEARAYTPHLTIARVQRSADPDARRALGRALGSEATDSAATPASFTVTEIVLMQSDLQPSGSVYTILARYPLRRIKDSD